MNDNENITSATELEIVEVCFYNSQEIPMAELLEEVMKNTVEERPFQNREPTVKLMILINKGKIESLGAAIATIADPKFIISCESAGDAHALPKDKMN